MPGYGCVPHERVCDHHNDCGDWQDEPGSCHQAGHHCDAGDNGGCDQVMTMMMILMIMIIIIMTRCASTPPADTVAPVMVDTSW